MPYKMRGLTFDQFEVGQVFETMSRTIAEADVVNFAGVSVHAVNTEDSMIYVGCEKGRVMCIKTK